jgi:splicing factor 3A subunit 1
MVAVDNVTIAESTNSDTLVIPPPEIRSIIEITANHVAKKGIQFEETIREKEGTNSKFYFLKPADPYHAYYQYKITEAKQGRGTCMCTG